MNLFLTAEAVLTIIFAHPLSPILYARIIVNYAKMVRLLLALTVNS